MLHFLHEILVEILLALPVKSLFECESKPWLSLISDPKFALLRQQQASQEEKINTHRILLATTTNLKSLDCLTESLESLHFPWRIPDSIEIIGSCNGLHKDYFIWKPSTGIYRKLPDLEVPFVEVFIYGFGYDLFSNEYGVFVRVLSMKANTWRKIPYYDAISYICPRRLDGCFVNGAIHWLGSLPDLS
ncbi:hypothetical protein CISIN_1g0426841mg, partial [Citrus sinensis]